jgi:hypothetical protein
MQLLAPFMLLGAAAISIPIGLHFFYRARYKPLPWAPMKFLKEAIEQTSRRLKFQEWILLALRCLALILLALALSRPGLRSAAIAGRGESIDVVFVIDTSLSMSANVGEGKNRLDKAKEKALAILDTLPTNSSIQIYGCADRAYLIGPVSRFNLDQARQLIPTIEVTSLSTDFMPGLSQALTSVQGGNAPAKEIYVFSDMQATGFQRQQGVLRAKCDEIKEQANLVFVRCGNPERRVGNIAIEDVRLVSDIPHTRSRVPFIVDLKNTGTETVKGLHVQLFLDGKALEKNEVVVDQIDAGQIHPVTMTGSLDEAGPKVLVVQIANDDLPGDNILYRIINVRDKIRVLLVDGTPNADNPLEGGDHYVITALNPARTPDFFIETDSVPANEVGPLHLDNKDIVYLLNAPIRDGDPLSGMSSEFLAKLKEFVQNGGGLIIGGGDRVNIPQYNKVLGNEGSQLLPYDITFVQNTSPEAPYFYPAPESIEPTSFLRKFREPPYSDAFRQVAIEHMFEINEAAPTSQVLARTTDYKPLIVSRVVGEGEVVMITTSLDERWGKFPSDGRVSIPLTRYMILYLTNRKIAGGTSHAGDPLVWHTSESSSSFDLVKPSVKGEHARQRIKIDAPEVEPGQKRTVTATDTLRAGVYNIVPAGRADTDGPLFAVNPSQDETKNMNLASDEDVRSWLGHNYPIIQSEANTEAAVNQIRTRSEWTVWILLLLLFLLVGEAVWAWTCGRAW